MISDLVADRVVEGVFAVKSKRRLRTKGGAPYLSLELVDAIGTDRGADLERRRAARRHASPRATPSACSDAWRRFSDRLQLDVRTLEAGRGRPVEPDADAAARRRGAAGIPRVPDRRAHTRGPGGDRPRGARRPRAGRVPGDARGPPLLRRRPARAHRRRSRRICRETAQLHPRLRSELARRGRAPARRRPDRSSSRAGPRSHRREEGRLLGHVHLGLRLIEARAEGLGAGQLAELLHCVAVHHDAACGADGRGRRALPREPARRARRDAAGRLRPAA